jgi:opacity protein-like surface antigen
VYALFLNAYIDFHTPTAFTPYLGGGLGVAHYEVKIFDRVSAQYTDPISHTDFVYRGYFPETIRPVEYTKRGTGLAWHFSVGLAYQISDSVALDLSYRYVDYGSIEIDRKLIVRNYPVQAGQSAIEFGAGKLDLKAHQAILALRVNIL